MNYFGTFPRRAVAHFSTALNPQRSSLNACTNEVKRKRRARIPFSKQLFYFLVRKTPRGFVVTLTGRDRQLRAANAHLDGVIVLGAIDVLGAEGDRVFVASLLG